jgi:hypothetical protein
MSLSHTDVREHTCGYHGCEKAFATAQRKREHEKTHFKTKEFVCTQHGECGEVFRKKSTLAAHVAKVHLGVKPFPCQEVTEQGEPCKAAYDTAGKLNEHVRKWHSGPKFFCTLCVDASEEEGIEGAEASDISMGGIMPSSPASTTASQAPGFQTLQLLLLHKRTHHPQTHEPKPRGRPPLGNKQSKIKIPKQRSRNNQHTSSNNNSITTRPSPLSTVLESSQELLPQMPCFRTHCSSTFTSEAALEAHCQLEHGMALVEIADELYERNALQSGVFWMGGIDPRDERNYYYDNGAGTGTGISGEFDEDGDMDVDGGMGGERVDVGAWDAGAMDMDMD